MEPWPDDPQAWSDEQWLAWLADTDDEATPPTAPPRARSAPWGTGIGGELLGAAMTGMAEAIYGPREPPAIVEQAAGGPPDDDALDLELDFEHPEHSVVVIRPWLLRRGGTPPDG